VYRYQAHHAEVTPSKQLNLALEPLAQAAQKRKPYIPPPDHPWRQFRVSNKSKQQPANPPG
jgi:hypothetical protein